MKKTHPLNHLTNYLEKYLKSYAEKKIDALVVSISASLHSHQFDHCLIIPIYNEPHDFIESLITKLNNKVWSSVLIILVINQPDTDDNITPNQEFWLKFKAFKIKNSHNEGLNLESSNHHFLCLNHTESCSSIIALDFFTQERKLARKKGVGLARKIGCDLACHLIQQEILLTDWLHTSDADTQLPDDYFHQTTSINSTGVSAAVYDFIHTGEDNLITYSTQLYEKSLHYYVDGLRFANSIYAYHTLGSCIAINTMSYLVVRGFTKRAGGEDFYCLNKLAKIGKIKQLKGSKLHIASRNSDRVPFGTGPAVEKILKNSESLATFMTYNPIIFYRLKNLLLSFEDLYNYKELPQEWLEQQPQEIKTTLQRLHISILFDHITSQIKDQQSCMRHIHDWFDAFKTLKFIHMLEQTHPKVNLEIAKNQLKAGFNKQSKNNCS